MAAHLTSGEVAQRVLTPRVPLTSLLLSFDFIFIFSFPFFLFFSVVVGVFIFIYLYLFTFIYIYLYLYQILSFSLFSRHFTGDIRFLLERKKQLSEAQGEAMGEEEEEEVIDAWFLSSPFEG